MDSLQKAVLRSQNLTAAGKKQYVEPDPAPQPASPGPEAPPADFAGTIAAPVRGVIDAPLVTSAPAWQTNSPLTGKGSVSRSAGTPLGALPTGQNNSAAQTASQEAAAASKTASTLANRIVVSVSNNKATYGTLGTAPTSTGPTSPTPTSPITHFPHPPLILSHVSDDPTFVKMVSNAATNNQPDLSMPGMLMKGSVPPSFTNSWGYSSTATSITLYSNPAILNRADGTFVNAGLYSQIISGLTASTPYRIYPYYSEALQSIQLVTAPNNLATTTGITFGASGFAATSSTVTTPTSFAIEFWFQSTQAAPVPIFSASGAINSATGNATNPCFSINISAASNIQIVYKTTASDVATNFSTTNTPNLLDGNWHHVAIGFHPAATAAAYAVVDGSIYTATPTSTFVPPAANVVFGIGVGFTTVPATILATTTTIGPIAFWNSNADYAANAQSLYNAGVMLGSAAFCTYVQNAAPTAPTNLWELNETTGTTLNDVIAANNATLRGSSNTLNVSSSTVNALGSPAAAWNIANIVAAALQNGQGNIPLTSAGISITTPASGSGGSAQPGSTIAAIVGRNNALL